MRLTDPISHKMLSNLLVGFFPLWITTPPSCSRNVFSNKTYAAFYLKESHRIQADQNKVYKYSIMEMHIFALASNFKRCRSFPTAHRLTERKETPLM